ncbi:MAG TPA: ABC transporter permease, partial [Microbacterium sp.]|nr:ABC transporter permease [Microbacterium sp.]
MTSTLARPASDAPAKNPDRPPRRIGFGHRLSRWDLKLSPYLYISPFFILFFVVGLFPIAYTAVISFMDWDLVRNSGEFIGFEQYTWVLSNPKFWIALRNTFSIFLLSSVPQLIIAIFIAAMLDQNIRAKTFWRMGVLVPYVMAPVAVALIFSNMFADQYGLVNNFLASIGIPAVPWHSDAFASHIA